MLSRLFSFNKKTDPIEPESKLATVITETTPNIQPDEPAVQDLIGPHSEIADSIFEMAHTIDRPITILLSGEYGSGKSTIVNLLALKSKANGDELFQFDAWSHSGNALRSAILCTWLPILVQKKLLSQQEATAKSRIYEGLESQEEKHQIQNYSIVSWVVTIAWALPGITLFFPSVGKDASVSLLRYFYIIAISLIIFSFCLSFVMNNFNGRTFFERLANVVAELTKNAFRSKTITQRTSEMNSVEFEKAYKELLSLYTLEQSSQIIVLDNLDRIEKQKDEAWSLVSQLNHIHLDKAFQDKKLILLVPYSHISADSNKDHISKLFHLTINVPPPHLHHWQSLLSNELTCLKSTFIDSAIDDIYAICQSFYKKTTVPTPRQIRTFINTFEYNYKYRSDQRIGHAAVAYYSLLTLGNIEFSELFNSQTDTNTRARFGQLDINILHELVALHYKTKIKDAAEIIYLPVIEDFVENQIELPTDLELAPSFAVALCQYLETSKEHSQIIGFYSRSLILLMRCRMGTKHFNKALDYLVLECEAAHYIDDDDESLPVTLNNLFQSGYRKKAEILARHCFDLVDRSAEEKSIFGKRFIEIRCENIARFYDTSSEFRELIIAEYSLISDGTLRSGILQYLHYISKKISISEFTLSLDQAQPINFNQWFVSDLLHQNYHEKSHEFWNVLLDVIGVDVSTGIANECRALYFGNAFGASSESLIIVGLAVYEFKYQTVLEDVWNRVRDENGYTVIVAHHAQKENSELLGYFFGKATLFANQGDLAEVCEIMSHYLRAKKDFRWSDFLRFLNYALQLDSAIGLDNCFESSSTEHHYGFFKVFLLYSNEHQEDGALRTFLRSHKLEIASCSDNFMETLLDLL